MIASRPIRRAIPGQPTDYSAPPEGAVARAIARINALAWDIGTRNMWSCAAPSPLTACAWQPPLSMHDALSILINHPDAWINYGSGYARTIYWRWGRLVDFSDGWYEPGWHPDAAYYGLVNEWRYLINRALNRPNGVG